MSTAAPANYAYFIFINLLFLMTLYFSIKFSSGCARTIPLHISITTFSGLLIIFSSYINLFL